MMDESDEGSTEDQAPNEQQPTEVADMEDDDSDRTTMTFAPECSTEGNSQPHLPDEAFTADPFDANWIRFYPFESNSQTDIATYEKWRRHFRDGTDPDQSTLYQRYLCALNQSLSIGGHSATFDETIGILALGQTTSFQEP
jgi:hypothetical protein